jgi:hypothetical protein
MVKINMRSFRMLKGKKNARLVKNTAPGIDEKRQYQ